MAGSLPANQTVGGPQNWCQPAMLTDDRVTGIDEPVLWRACVDASLLLGAATGNRWLGVWRHDFRPTVEIRAVPRGAWDGFSAGYGWNSWTGVGSTVTLPQHPVRRVLEVVVDGAVVDPATYRLEARRLLRRLGSAVGVANAWPDGQDLSLEPDQVGTWLIRYEWGLAPPPDGVAAAVELATEFALARAGRECRLPQRTQTIVREEVSVTFPDPMTFLDKGRTGLIGVDLFLSLRPRYTPARIAKGP